MDQEELKQRVLNFLKSQTKASIATNKENNPWVSDLYYITDNFGNLYFLIYKASQTSEI